MVDVVLKLTKPEMSVTTANTIYSSVLFRVFSPNISVITTKNATGTIIGSMTMLAGFVEVMYKGATDTVEATSAVLCTPIAYK